MFIRYETSPSDHPANWHKVTVKEIVASIAFVVGVIGLVVFLIWLFSQNPEPVPSSAETQVAAAAENAYALVQEVFDYMVENEVFIILIMRTCVERRLKLLTRLDILMNMILRIYANKCIIR